MEWIVKIDNNAKLRIVVKIEPLNDVIRFVGQYNYKSNWIDFSETTRMINIDIHEIKDCLELIYGKMSDRLVKYENIAKIFSTIKNIQFVDVENINGAG